MTSRERVLGRILLGALGAAACLFGFTLYLGRLRSIDADIAAAEARAARMETALRGARAAPSRGRPRTAAPTSPELFLSGFDRAVRSAGWKTESTLFKGRKDGIARFSISIEGPGSGWESLLKALEAWDARILIESIEAAASRSGRMRAGLEAGYALE
jgi:hypothetical protein